MPAKIKPITDAIRKETYGLVNTTLTNKDVGYVGANVQSPAIFGKKETSSLTGLEYQGTYNRLGYIDLALPVLNFFLAGTNCNIIKKILGEQDLSEIAKGSIIYDVKNRQKIFVENIKADMLYDRENILIGGDYIKYLVTNLNIRKEIRKEIFLIVKSVLGSQAAIKKEYGIETWEDVGNYCSIGFGSGEIQVIGDVYLNIVYEFKGKKVLEADVAKMINTLLVEEPVFRLAYLTALLDKDRYDTFINFVQNTIVVMPVGYRPQVDNRRDKITLAYNAVVAKNYNLTQILKFPSATVKSVRVAYNDLVNAIINLTVKESNYSPKNYKCLLSTLTGKQGIIRSHMQSTREDYSARTVIIVDPFMSIDTVGIPKKILVKLFELSAMEEYKTNNPNKSSLLAMKNRKLLANLAVRKAEKDGYVVPGRQPTLYRLGVQAFKLKAVDGDAIVLNPLCVDAFNADFDGDQMHVTIPISEKAKTEVQCLMANTKNVFLPRDGECHIAPRHEMIYGLWLCSKIEPRSDSKHYILNGTADDYLKLFDDVCENRINIYDTVDIGDLKHVTAGVAAIKAALSKKYAAYRLGVLPLTTDTSKKEKPTKGKWYKTLLGIIAEDNEQLFITVTNRVVKLGFKIANIFPPDVSILNVPDIQRFIREFDTAVNERKWYYNIGMETEDSYATYYSKQYKILENKVKKFLLAELGPDNGYIRMMESGARGSMSNILQMFGFKGRVKKNSVESFNVIIKNGMNSSLTELEANVTAYGARQGQIDKSIKTFEPGYMARVLSHVTNAMQITSNDCGTTDGLLIDFDFIKKFISNSLFTGNPEIDNSLVQDYVTDVLIGRYIVGSDHEIMDEKMAKGIYREKIAEVIDGKLVKKAGVKMRSPITCSNPCCVKCYGVDLSKRRDPRIGTPIGYDAAQSIGEPGTQTTMKNFQDGGVVGAANITSTFDQMTSYLGLVSLAKKTNNRVSAINYDYISPIEGKISTISLGNGIKKLQILQLNKDGEWKNKLMSKVLLYDSVKLKDHVKVGESIQLVEGNHDIKEIMKYQSVEEAQRYLAFMLFNIYRDEVYVSIKHFEVVVASMIFYVCRIGNDYFRPGCFYTVQEYWSHDTSKCEFAKTLVGTNRVPLKRTDLFSTIFLERVQEGISRSILLSGKDEMKIPYVRATFGLHLGIGSDVDGFLS